MKSLDQVESLTSHLQLNFHPLWLAFLVQEIITKLLMHLPHSKEKKKNHTADFSVNSQTGHVGNWQRAPDAHRARKEMHKHGVMEIVAKEVKQENRCENGTIAEPCITMRKIIRKFQEKGL